MKRGNVVLVRMPNSPASKARPCLVVQRDSTLDDPLKVTVCPLTTTLRGITSRRPFVAPSSENGLDAPSEVQIDWVYTFEVVRIGAIIGMVDVATMREVDTALRRWLDL